MATASWTTSDAFSDQVKIRGFRVELGEVEAALLTCPGIAHAAACVRDNHGVRRLIGYVVPAAEGGADAAAIQHHLEARLQERLVPSAFVELPALPLTSHGKVDRRALPAPAFAQETYRTPRTPQEEIVCHLYAEVLGLERAGLGDDFFDLGGHSLTAMRLMSRVRARFDVNMPLASLFERRTVERLTAAIEERLLEDVSRLSETEALRLVEHASGAS